MDLRKSDRLKRGFQLLIGGFLRMMGTDKNEIAEQLEHAAYPPIVVLHEILNEITSQTTRKHHQNIMLEVGRFPLWVAYRDEAYRDQFDAFLLRLFERADEIVPHLERKPARNWHVNIFEEEYTQRGPNMRDWSSQRERLDLEAEIVRELEEALAEEP